MLGYRTMTRPSTSANPSEPVRCESCAPLEALLEAQSAKIEALSTQIKAQSAQIAALQAQIEELKAQPRRTSRNSNKPPSSDPPGSTRKPARRGKVKRAKGGQPGHRGKTRQMLPVDQMDEVVDCLPEQCVDCGHHLEGTDAKPERHQVVELPEKLTFRTEYRLHSLTCPTCKRKNSGRLPQQATWSAFGPRLHALVAYLTASCRLSKRRASVLLDEVFDIKLSVGSISNIEQSVSRALALPFNELSAFIKSQMVIHLDETSWCEGPRRNGHWLWVVVCRLAALFVVRKSRGSVVARELIGEDFEGHIVTDRWSAYTWVDTLKRQLCWSHLIRDFVKISEFKGKPGKAGKALLKHSKKLFRLWRRVKAGTLKHSGFKTRVLSGLRQDFKAALQQGVESGHKKTAGMCAAILKLEPAMWAFAHIEGIEPTNNDAERALRHAVILRKISFGTDSPRGTRFIERILSAVTTLRLQGRKLLEYLEAACAAHAAGRDPPSLLPEPVTA